jgi:PhnB protein
VTEAQARTFAMHDARCSSAENLRCEDGSIVIAPDKSGATPSVENKNRENVMSVKPIPEGYHSITPYLGIQQAAEAIDFYKKAFNASEVMRLTMPDGNIGHAELRIGDSAIMLGTPCDQGPLSNPQQAVSIGLHLYVTDVDQSFRQALDAGAQSVSEVKDQFYGDRSGTLRDPFGHLWFLATHKEDLSEEQIRQRAMEMFNQN